MNEWRIFQGTGTPHDGLASLPPSPPWRLFSNTRPGRPQKPEHPPFEFESEEQRGKPIQVKDDLKLAVNAALFLRRPLLVTGKPGVGKSSLAFAVAYELRMGPVLTWPITSRSTVRSGLYEYDAVGRLQSEDKTIPLGRFFRLGPLGTALYPTTWPRTLLIDEIDKGDLDLPNDLLNILEDGRFEIDELARAHEERVSVRLHRSDDEVSITKGKVESDQFPFIVMTSNGEREFPAPFLRRCVRITIPPPDLNDLKAIVDAHLERHLDQSAKIRLEAMIRHFLSLRDRQELATDQLLNAVFAVLGDGRSLLSAEPPENDPIVQLLLKQLTGAEAS